MSKKSMFSVFKSRMLPKQIRQQRAKLHVEMMDSRINPALILVNDPVAGIINGVQSQNAGEFCILFAASNNNHHRVDVFDDTANTGSGIRVVGTDFGADNTEGTADDVHNDYVITDSDMTTLGQIRNQIWRGVAIDLSYNTATMVDPPFSAGGHGGGNDIISGAPGDAKYLPPGFFFGDQGLGFTNPTQHRLCQANGGGGNDTICGGNSNDVLTGGAGNDVLAGGNGRDSMYGGDGYDCVLADNADLFGGSNVANVSGGTGGPEVGGGTIAGDLLPDLLANGVDRTGAGRYAQSDALLITDGSGASSTSVYTNTDFEVIWGGSGADNIVSNNGVRRGVEMYGNDGNDYLQSTSAGGANSGRDTIYGGAGNDTILGGDGNDLIHGDAIQPGQAASACSPNPFPELTALPCLSATLCGGQTIGSMLSTPSVGSGNDSLAGENGDDTVEGGLGNDTFVGGAGSDVMCDLGGNDTVNYCNSPAAVTVILGNINAPQSASVFAGGDAQGDSTPIPTAIENVWGSNFADFIQGNEANNFLDGNGGDDTMFGVAGDDTMEGGAGSDYMYGDNGADAMYGQEGGDNMEGGNGNDSMFGGSGDDLLEGQRGNDCINGGTGNDTADGGLGTDSFILDFGNGQNPTSLQNALANPGPFLNNTLKATAGNDPVPLLPQLVPGVGDQYFGGAGRDTFQVYGAWIEINPGTANARLVADNGRVNDVGNFLSNISNLGNSDFNTSGSLNNTDVVQYNTDFNASPLATAASDYTQARFQAGLGPNGANLCRHIEGLSICGPDPVLPAGQPAPIQP